MNTISKQFQTKCKNDYKEFFLKKSSIKILNRNNFFHIRNFSLSLSLIRKKIPIETLKFNSNVINITIKYNTNIFISVSRHQYEQI